jgi:hypothetical protein
MYCSNSARSWRTGMSGQFTISPPKLKFSPFARRTTARESLASTASMASASSAAMRSLILFWGGLSSVITASAPSLSKLTKDITVLH